MSTPRTDSVAKRYEANEIGPAEVLSYASQLERENAALKKALDAQADYQRELRADRDRLDWLCMTDHWFDVPSDENWTPESFRAAIDAAMGEGKL